MDQTVLTVEYMNERNKALTKAGEVLSPLARASINSRKPERNCLRQVPRHRASGRHDAQAS